MPLEATAHSESGFGLSDAILNFGPGGTRILDHSEAGDWFLVCVGNHDEIRAYVKNNPSRDGGKRDGHVPDSSTGVELATRRLLEVRRRTSGCDRIPPPHVGGYDSRTAPSAATILETHPPRVFSRHIRLGGLDGAFSGGWRFAPGAVEEVGHQEMRGEGGPFCDWMLHGAEERIWRWPRAERFLNTPIRGPWVAGDCTRATIPLVCSFHRRNVLSPGGAAIGFGATVDS